MAAGRAAAMKTAEGATNYAFHGLPVGTFARGILERRMAARLARESWAPEAGLDYTPPNLELAQKLRK
jgi:hypothetical protein